MNTGTQPQVGDFYEFLGSEVCIAYANAAYVVYVRGLNYRPSVTSMHHFLNETRLIERGGKRREALWECFRYGECPEWRQRELHQAFKFGAKIERNMDDGQGWESLYNFKPMQTSRYRIKNRENTR